MTRQEIIREVVKIILKHTKPARIYLYGSEATGEATKTSDIDIAYDDNKFKDNYLIEEELEKLQTLLKIDMKNIAFTEERFKNRIKTTGKVLYSANTTLRAEDGLYNFTRAYERFANAIERKDELYQEGFSDIYLDLIVKRFEFTYEMSWKAIKRYLMSVGIECLTPKDCFKEAYTQGLIRNEEVWLDMLEQRNLFSHVYSEDEVKEILDKLDRYNEAFFELKNNLESKLKGAKPKRKKE